MRKWTWFLRLLIGGLALLAVAVGVFPFSIMLKEMFEQAPHHLAPVVVILGIGLYLAILGFLAAAVFVERLLGNIDRNQAFSSEAVTNLKRIEWSLAVVTVGFWLWLPFIYTITQLDDAPGILLIGLGLSAIPLTLTVFMAVLVRLWAAALRLKNENEQPI